MKRIGYACLALAVPDTDFKSCTMKNATDERLLELIAHNLSSLENLVDYNIRNGILLFRISSDIIPFGSSQVNQLEWWNIFGEDFDRLRNKIKTSGMRVSMHPGQYTVLNSPDEGIVQRAVADLEYHNRFMECLGATSENKIILHLGGVYGEPAKAKERFLRNYSNLSDSIKEKLVLENDDRSYTICDVLETAMKAEIPVVYDNLHNSVKDCGSSDDVVWIRECHSTWKERDGRQKIHYSQQDKNRQPGAHTGTIGIDEFLEFYDGLDDYDIDIMLEVKDKNVSAIKCMNCTDPEEHEGNLQRDWARYKYMIMEKSQEKYKEGRQLFSEKKYPAVEFYRLVESCMDLEIKLGEAINAAEHVWGYFKDAAEESEKRKFMKSLEKYKSGKASLASVKNQLYLLAKKYDSAYLLESYYFI
ncbi:MAG TPA: UV DNA damage repair endonuclease UvsE [Clostridia bacterium]|nr:UV DNA damage repair endonuclease UvsE [Clostridia bacterium]